MIVLNLFGGPGAGKSTTAALTFGKLKQAGINAELVVEFAKDLVWEERHAIRCQPYVFGEQLWRLERLRGKVDAVVTDSPILLSAVYGAELGDAFCSFVLGTFAGFDNVNVFLDRDDVAHPYSSAGRYQADVDEASAIDVVMHDMLHREVVDHTHVPMGDGSSDTIAQAVMSEW